MSDVAPTRTSIRLLLVEDQRILREGLRTILDLETGIEVVAEAEDGVQAVELAFAVRPDVVLMDLKMPRMDGVEATRRIVSRLSETRVVILTTYDHDNLVLDALRAGAKGYLLKDAPADDMIRAIHLAHRGESLLQPVVAAKLLDAFTQMGDAYQGSWELSGGRAARGTLSMIPPGAATCPASSGAEPLTERERQVLILVAEGVSNVQIARRLYLAEGTVKNHISMIMGKLGACNRTQAVSIARQQGLII
jgi:DNA-binding NarL/FixJ family response regulator